MKKIKNELKIKNLSSLLFQITGQPLIYGTSIAWDKQTHNMNESMDEWINDSSWIKINTKLIILDYQPLIKEKHGTHK